MERSLGSCNAITCRPRPAVLVRARPTSRRARYGATIRDLRRLPPVCSKDRELVPAVERGLPWLSAHISPRPDAESTPESRKIVPQPRVGRHRPESFGITASEHDVVHVEGGTELANHA